MNHVTFMWRFEPKNQPDFIYRKENIYSSSKITKSNAKIISATRLKVIDNRVPDKKTLYQKTTVKSRPLAYPFMNTLGGGISNIHLKLSRSKKTLNALSDEDTQNIFGLFEIADIEESSEDKIQILNNYLDESSDRAQEAKQLFDSLWLALDNKDSISLEEVALIARALNDDRIEFSYVFPKVIRKLDGFPDELVLALGNRILRKPEYPVSNAIMVLPEGKAAIIAPQLEKLTKDDKLRAQHWKAVTRLGDGSDNAVGYYINMLKDYKNFLSSGNALRDVRKNEEYMVSGAILGLCRLGEKASGAKEDLYSILEMGNKSTKPSRRVVRALLQIVSMAELEDRYLNDELYKNNDRIGREIKRSIRDKEVFENNARNPCI